jgi:hypothetical protein
LDSNLSFNRQNVLLDIFNLGILGLLKFKKTLAILKMEIIECFNEMLKSKWAKQVGIRAYNLSIMMDKDIPFNEL